MDRPSYILLLCLHWRNLWDRAASHMWTFTFRKSWFSKFAGSSPCLQLVRAHADTLKIRSHKLLVEQIKRRSTKISVNCPLGVHLHFFIRWKLARSCNTSCWSYSKAILYSCIFLWGFTWCFMEPISTWDKLNASMYSWELWVFFISDSNATFTIIWLTFEQSTLSLDIVWRVGYEKSCIWHIYRHLSWNTFLAPRDLWAFL